MKNLKFKYNKKCRIGNKFSKIKFINGFTLIELLSVLVIMGIIALITVPIVIGIITSSEKKSAKLSANGFYEACKNFYMVNKLGHNMYEDYECTISEKNGCSELNYDGTKPDKATLLITQAGEITAEIEYGKYKYYICNGNILENKNDSCSVNNYEKIYAITNNGMITGFKEVNNVSFNLIKTVKAASLTNEAIEMLNSKILIIPEYVGDIKVKGVEENAFKNYDIRKVIIKSPEKIIVSKNCFPETIEEIIVPESVENEYDDFDEIISSTPSQDIESTLYLETEETKIIINVEKEIEIYGSNYGKLKCITSNNNITCEIKNNKLLITGNKAGKAVVSVTGNNLSAFLIVEVISSTIFDGNVIANVTERYTTDSDTGCVKKIANGAIDLTCQSGWYGETLYLENLTIDSTIFEKLVIEAEYKAGYDYHIWFEDISGKVATLVSSNNSKALFIYGRNSFARQEFVVDLKDYSAIKTIVLGSSSLSSSLKVYSIRFE